MADQDDEFQQHIVYQTTLPNTTPAEAFDAFARVIWWGGGGFGAAGVVVPGDVRTLEGSVRAVPLGIHEAAQRVDYPTSFGYTLARKSIFPVSAHRGEVTFRALKGEESTTLVVWNVHYTPFRCMNWFARTMIAFLPYQLSALKSSVEEGGGHNNSVSKPKSE
jgi:hypothetical protein